MPRREAVDVRVCVHVQARGCRCRDVCACAGTGLQVRGCACMWRHGAAEVWGCVRMPRREAVDVRVCVHVQARGCRCGSVRACAGTGL